MYKIKPLRLKDIKIDDKFWGRYRKLVREKVIPYQWEALNDRVPDAARSGCIANFTIAANHLKGDKQGDFYGMVFQDSDLYKWLESVAFSLETSPDAELEKLADGAVELIGAAQEPDGYINTYYTIKMPGKRFTNLQHGHELYCAGHMIEAAAAYYNATGKRRFLDISIRFAECIENTFGLDEGKIQGYPGHQVIELALVKLYSITGERRWLSLADYFLRQRGAKPHYFELERAKDDYKEIFPVLTAFDWSYSQSHIPVTDQKNAIGHSVRAVYQYSAMADLAAELGHSDMADACAALYEDIKERKMYVTGAIGSTREGESFTGEYDLPPDTVYGETCASVGLMMFCRRMAMLHGNAGYMDVCERALLNTVLAGMSLSGTEFYYVNPLETEPRRIAGNLSLSHVKPVRQKWFDCSCCPTNVARTILNLGEYLFGMSEEGLYINLYCSAEAAGGERRVKVQTDYPYGNEVSIKAWGGRYKLFFRNPENAPVLSVSVNGKNRGFTTENGYIVLKEEWDGCEIKLTLDMKPKLVYTSLNAQRDIGKAAIMRGPLVYCAEEADNGPGLGSFLLQNAACLTEIAAPDGLPAETVALTAPVLKYKTQTKTLYSSNAPELEDAKLNLIPYFLWANRGENEMRVHFLYR
ncbi:MAG: glycoside hydrolase family 127 protein [Defluviitaleaceae bacterium]|nr:glycoside hydrolase family 127 protein [Defluviitaleaceae bacterium]MCL2835742.1 glycoside hydrolase family 127 protein [Defluviitaleaceae bacterium]